MSSISGLVQWVKESGVAAARAQSPAQGPPYAKDVAVKINQIHRMEYYLVISVLKF